MAKPEERLSRPEGAYEHLATKADLQELRAYVESALKSQTRWFAGILVVQTGVITGLVVGLQKLLE